MRFLVELALLAGAAALAWTLLRGWWRWPGAIVAVVAVAALWGLFLSPKAAVPLPPLAALGIGAARYLGVGCGLWAVGLGLQAVVGVIVWGADRLALALLGPASSASP
ncbi:MAG: DUF2568 domain-containing protein [Leucobacter sp.]